MGFQRLTQELPAAATTTADDSLDYKAFYRAKVVSQNTDGPATTAVGGTLDIAPVDTRFGSFQQVPCMWGIPGASIQVQPGSYVFFTFWNGQPGQVYVASWDPGNSVVEMDLNGQRIKLNPGATGHYIGNGVARVADTVDCGTFTFSFDPGSGDATCTLTWSPPAGGSGSIGSDQVGVITSGNSTVLA